MATEIKFTYFDLKVKGEAARLLLAYGGYKYTDDRITPPWDDMNNWQAMKPTMPWGQLPCLTWNGERLCQSMTICRFLAREMGIAGRNSLEMAQVDEIVDVIQDVITANYDAYFASNKKEELEKWTQTTVTTALSQLEKKLTERGGQFMVGNNFTWADLHMFFFCSEDFLEPEVIQKYPHISNLVERVGSLPRIKTWIESRPANPNPKDGFMIVFKNAFKLLSEKIVV